MVVVTIWSDSGRTIFETAFETADDAEAKCGLVSPEQCVCARHANFARRAHACPVEERTSFCTRGRRKASRRFFVFVAVRECALL